MAFRTKAGSIWAVTLTVVVGIGVSAGCGGSSGSGSGGSGGNQQPDAGGQGGAGAGAPNATSGSSAGGSAGVANPGGGAGGGFAGAAPVGGEAGTAALAGMGGEAGGEVGAEGGAAGEGTATDYALQFNGTTDLVYVPYSTSLDVTTAVTLEAWVYATSAAGGAIGGMWGNGGIADKYLLQLNGGNVIARIVRQEDPSQTTASVTMPLNAWTHVAFTYDGSNILIYLNGVQAASTAAPGSLPAEPLPFRLGIEDINLGTSTFLAGELDEVRVWNVARTAQEIASNYQASVLAASTGLVAYYHFNEAPSSQIVVDATGANNGTLGLDANVGADDPTRVVRPAN
ncbi:MAG TPA: LamG domain-containing protein [Polyangiaceae bacterium]|jgi:hypothetical protein|nr:LamG domain-containing protein [Polyangiaceae bacterium]